MEVTGVFAITLYFVVELSSKSYAIMTSSWHFNSASICNLQQRIELSCYTLWPPANNTLQCAVKCANENWCLAISLTTQKECFLHLDCPAVSSCSQADNGHIQFVKAPHLLRCRHGSKWDFAKNRCKCTDNWVGQFCERLPQTCAELLFFGYPYGHYNNVEMDIYRNGSVGTIVHCFVDTVYKYARFYIAKGNGQMNFDKTWDEYLRGFQMDSSNLWLGFQHFYHVNHLGFDNFFIRIHFKIVYNGILLRFKRQYTRFNLSDESSLFSFSYEDSIKTVSVPNPPYHFEGCIEPLAGVPFSTKDRDHDEVENTNCASLLGNGWWYSNCGPLCNVFAMHAYDPSKNDNLMFFPGINMTVMSPDYQYFEMFLEQK